MVSVPSVSAATALVSCPSKSGCRAHSLLLRNFENCATRTILLAQFCFLCTFFKSVQARHAQISKVRNFCDSNCTIFIVHNAGYWFPSPPSLQVKHWAGTCQPAPHMSRTPVLSAGTPIISLSSGPSWLCMCNYKATGQETRRVARAYSIIRDGAIGCTQVNKF